MNCNENFSLGFSFAEPKKSDHDDERLGGAGELILYFYFLVILLMCLFVFLSSYIL